MKKKKRTKTINYQISKITSRSRTNISLLTDGSNFYRCHRDIRNFVSFPLLKCWKINAPPPGKREREGRRWKVESSFLILDCRLVSPGNHSFDKWQRTRWRIQIWIREIFLNVCDVVKYWGFSGKLYWRILLNFFLICRRSYVILIDKKIKVYMTVWSKYWFHYLTFCTI